MATTRNLRSRTVQIPNEQSSSDSVIDLTADSPLNTEHTDQSVISLEDSTVISSPITPTRVKDFAEKKSPMEKCCKKTISEFFFCPMCLEGLKFHNAAPEKRVMSTQCGHAFCYSCIVAIISKSQECPMCRKKQTIQDIHPLYM